MYALGLGNFLDALSKNDVGINPAALDLRQRVECVPQTDEQLHTALQAGIKEVQNGDTVCGE